MKKLKGLISFVMVLAIALFMVFVPSYTFAKSNIKEYSLHEMTKVYSRNASGYYDGCEDYLDYQNQAPEMTILTHGFNSQSYHWSNTYSQDTKGQVFSYNKASLITKISNRLGGNVTIYEARMDYNRDEIPFKYDFDLVKYNTMLEEQGTSERIDDVSKHIIVVFNSAHPAESNDDVYEEFEYMVDTLSMQYKALTGVLPRLNLVGHSRGGITNIQYATEHPYNVSSISSLGTPYNGSALGNADFILDAMNYRQADGNFLPGVVSLTDPNEAMRIRDAWNKANTPEVNINAVAYGSMTSVEFLEGFLKDAEQFPDYKGLEDYNTMIELICRMIKNNPKTVSSTIDFINGIGEVFGKINIDIYDTLLTLANKEFKGMLTKAEAERILKLYDVINGEGVIMDDLFIDTNSQLGVGFEDGVEFNGFKRYVKIFHSNDITPNRSCSDSPAVVHNLEAMNDTYTDSIANSLVFSTHKEQDLGFMEDNTYTLNFRGETAFILDFDYRVKRKISALNCELSVYEYDENGICHRVEVDENYDYKITKYLVVLYNETNATSSVTFEVNDVLYSGASKTLTPYEKRLYRISPMESGFYSFNSSNSDVVFYGLKTEGKKESYGYVSEEDATHVLLKNKTNQAKQTKITIAAPEKINLGDEMTSISSNPVYVFENTFSYDLTYQLEVTNASASFYTENGESVYYPVKTTSPKVYTITLKQNEIVYIAFSSSGSCDIKIDERQMKWTLDGAIITQNTRITKGENHVVSLKMYDTNNTYKEEVTSFIYTPSDNFTLDGKNLFVSDNGLIGYDIILTPSFAPEYQKAFTICFDNDFSMSTINSEDVTLYFRSTVGTKNTLQAINYTITTGGRTTNYQTSNNTNVITSKLSSTEGTSTIHVTSIVINGMTIQNSTKFLTVADVTVDNLYDHMDSTYRYISCFRHLENAKKNSSKSFKLMKSLDFANYNEFYFTSFSGTFEGNGYTIKNYTVKIKGNESYGFFRINTGKINNLDFSNCKIVYESGTGYNAGIVCGENRGTLYDCDVNDSSVNTTSIGNIGMLTGKNTGTLEYCYVSDATMTVSGNAAAVCGANYNNITRCSGDAEIIYSHQGTNGNIGEIAGYNKGSVTNNTAYGKITFNSPSRNRNILPSIGKVVGYNESGCTVLNNTAGTGYSCNYYYWYFIGYFDQGKRLFKVQDGQIGYQA